MLPDIAPPSNSNSVNLFTWKNESWSSRERLFIDQRLLYLSWFSNHSKKSQNHVGSRNFCFWFFRCNGATNRQERVLKSHGKRWTKNVRRLRRKRRHGRWAMESLSKSSGGRVSKPAAKSKYFHFSRLALPSISEYMIITNMTDWMRHWNWQTVMTP